MRPGTGECTQRAHPRAGGDGACASAAMPYTAGLTPAQAGTAPLASGACLWGWAHPRAGGDGQPSMAPLCRIAGSPPRRRGRHGGDAHRFEGAGLTPAQAGTATPDMLRDGLPTAHPRAGGDGSSRSPVRWPRPGSPPRRRGRPPRGLRVVRPLGLTPAQAGTAGSPATTPANARAHPRAGGDGHHP